MFTCKARAKPHCDTPEDTGYVYSILNVYVSQVYNSPVDLPDLHRPDTQHYTTVGWQLLSVAQLAGESLNKTEVGSKGKGLDLSDLHLLVSQNYVQQLSILESGVQ